MNERTIIAALLVCAGSGAVLLLLLHGASPAPATLPTTPVVVAKTEPSKEIKVEKQPKEEEKQEEGPEVFALNQPLFGNSYGSWTTQWWRWVLAFPKFKSPLTDRSGAATSQNQSGPVYFLANTVETGGFRRRCTVPAGKAILVPLLNSVYYDPDAAEIDVSAGGDGLAEYLGGEIQIGLVVDGKELPSPRDYRVAAGPFEFTGPKKPTDAVLPGCAGRHKAMSDGYWVMLKPLSEGQHTLVFRGKNPNGDNLVKYEITYHLTVEKAK